MLRQVACALSIAVSCASVIAASPPSTPAAVSRASVPDAAELVNESGRLRMLTERMGKAYAQLALNLMPDKARAQIAQSQKRFEENLALLNRGATTPEIKTSLETITSSYKAYAKALATTPDKTSVAAAHRLTEKVVSEAENLTAAFESHAQVSNAKIVNVSGRQRMLSQRLARLYFAAALNTNQADTDKYRNEFKGALAILEAAPLSSIEIRREIDLAKTQWLFFEQALLGNGDLAGNLRNVATANERLLETMDNLTALYSKALRQLVG